MHEALNNHLTQLDPYDLFINTIFPAPIPNAPIPDYSELPLSEILNTLPPDELWRVANSFLKRKEFKQADKYLAEYLKKDPLNYKILSTRGLTQLFQADLKKAAYYLQRALTKNPTLFEARLWLAYIRLKEGKHKGATLHLAKAAVHKNKKQEAVRKILEIYLNTLEPNSGLKSEILKLDLFSENPQIRDIQTIFGFLEGRKELEKGDLVTATRIWDQTFKQNQEGWFKHHLIQSYLHTLGQKRLHFLTVTQEPNKQYQQVLEKLLHLVLLPEFFEEEDKLNEQLEYWKSKINAKGSYPYAHFRYSICLLYLGEQAQAYESLLVCRDKIPSSKVSFFKIDELIDWARS